MTNIIIIGAQWGDEGKGKVVDWLCQKAEVVVRFQGGNNAGHTVVLGEEEHHLSLLPSGVMHPDKLSILGNGVVIDPWVLCDEIEKMQQKGFNISPKTFMIAENAILVLPIHRAIDQAWEKIRLHDSLGTTRQGVGPAYEDKIARRAVRVCDLHNPILLKSKIQTLLSYHNLFLKSTGFPEQNSDDILSLLQNISLKILPYVDCVWRRLKEAYESNQNILFEGAQGVLLDLDHGTYPFVTASNTVTGQALIGSGFPLNKVDTVLGISKAYTTRVGEGPFPTEIEDQISQQISIRGHEFGTITGRKRRIGWFDAVATRQAIQLSGINVLAITKIDVLDTLKTLKICTQYHYNQQTFNHIPADQSIQAHLQPIYEILEGWNQYTYTLRNWDHLPKLAQQYIRRIEELVQVPVVLISTSPERNDMITLNNHFSNKLL